VFENLVTGAKRKVTTRTRSHLEGGRLRLEQDLVFSDGTRQHRSWRIRVSSGNTFQWSFILALSPGNSLGNVRMRQAMYLQRDGRSLINHTTILKFGIPVARVTETFRRQ
jgi:hypothetical protein